MMERQIRVLQLIDSGGMYGAENVIMNLSNGLKYFGHKSIIGCFQYKKKPEIVNEAMERGLDYVQFYLKNKLDIICIRDIAKYCKENKIDLLHSHGYKACFFCAIINLIYGIPYMITCHLLYIPTFRLQVYSFLEKLCMCKSSYVVGVSQPIVDQIGNKLIPIKKLALIHNGINIDAFSKKDRINKNEYKEKLNLKQNSIVVGSVGRLSKQKDHKTLIDAAALVLKEEKNVEFIIAGEGKQKKELTAYAKELKVHNQLHFLGFHEDISSLMAITDIFVLSSLEEGMPIALLEAMASKLSIITTPVGAIPSVIYDDVNGKIFDKGNYVQLKSIILELIKNPQKRKKLSLRAYDFVRSNFSNEKMTKKYINIYKNILNK